jgi:hypothetical protein
MEDETKERNNHFLRKLREKLITFTIKSDKMSNYLENRLIIQGLVYQKEIFISKGIF